MQYLTRANGELFRRTEDECFESLSALSAHGRERRAKSENRWQGRFTIFALVDALTRIAREAKNAGDRTDVDEKASKLLSFAAIAASGGTFQ